MDSPSSDVDSDTGSSLTDFAARSNLDESLEFSSETECNLHVVSEKKRRLRTGCEGTAAKRWFRAKEVQAKRVVFSSDLDKKERLEALASVGLTHKLRSNPKEALKNIG